METTNDLNQNSEEQKKATQDENSNPVDDSKKNTDETPVKKSEDSEKAEDKLTADTVNDAVEETDAIKKEDIPVGKAPSEEQIAEVKDEIMEVKAENDTSEHVSEVPPPESDGKMEIDQPENIVVEKSNEKDESVKDDGNTAPPVPVETLTVQETIEKPSLPSDELVPALDPEHDDEHDDEHEDDDHHEETLVEEQVNYDELEIEELVSLLEEMVSVDEITTLRKKVALVKVSFNRKYKALQEALLENVSEKEDKPDEKVSPKDLLQQRFDAAFKVYSGKRRAYLAQLEVQKQENLNTKKLILEELKALIESEESLKQTYDDFKALQDKWKAIGMVPKSEVNNLWQNYHFYVEKFFDKVKINKELRDLDLKKNLESKMELCEKAEELLLETSALKSFKKLQQYHKLWKEIGPVPQDKKDELWERFKSTTEKINQSRREHYDKQREAQESNFVAKTALCEKVEEVLKRENNSIKEWQTNTDEVSSLLKFWKTIGPAPRKQNDEIWERFRTSMDTFFAGKKEYFQKIKDEQLHNYNLKLDLCTQAEAIKTSTDWKTTTQRLINLQNEWKKVGPAPRKHSDKIWHRFRAACDEFFSNKSEYFANIKTHESDNLNAKAELVKKVEAFEFGKDKNENFDILKGFQREWTEIGHVPYKEKEKIQNAFRKAINDQLDKLKISKAEMQTVNFKQRFENLKENPEANRIVRNEKHFLTQKMKKLEEEIQLLENNMGFLAKSKKADLLIAEFNKKIDDARNEVQTLKEKIKFLERS